MKYNRFALIPGILTTPVFKEYELPVVRESNVRIVDDSSYVPNKKANEILLKHKALGTLREMAYDSPSDLKSGSVNVYARQKGRDMAEITQMQRRLEKQAIDEINSSLAENAKKRADAAAAAAAAADSGNSGDSGE